MDVYTFQKNGKKFTLDVNTSLFIETDSLSWEMFQSSGALDEEEVAKRLAPKYGPDSVSGALEDLRTVRSLGFFRDSPQEMAPDSLRPERYALYMDAVHNCTLRCRYCYSGGGDHYKAYRQKMSPETARRAVDFLVEEFGPDGKEYHISLTAGGEALLNYKLFKFLKSYCKAKGEQMGKTIGCGFGTNATRLTSDIIQDLCDMGQRVYVSIDGPKEVHDAMRVFPDGRGSYDLILPKMKEAIKRDIVTGACVTLTPCNTDFVAIVSHLMGLGFRAICMRPVRGSPDTFYAISQQNVEAIKRGYEELARFLLERLLDGEEGYFLALEPRDFLMRFFVRVLFRQGLLYRCKAAKTILGVTADGDLYPCSSFVGIDAFHMGNVYDGIDRANQQLFFDLKVDGRDSCRECWARYFCGGGCYH